jgi:hypothetical protein
VHTRQNRSCSHPCAGGGADFGGLRTYEQRPRASWICATRAFFCQRRPHRMRIWMRRLLAPTQFPWRLQAPTKCATRIAAVLITGGCRGIALDLITGSTRHSHCGGPYHWRLQGNCVRAWRRCGFRWSPDVRAAATRFMAVPLLGHALHVCATGAKQ